MLTCPHDGHRPRHLGHHHVHQAGAHGMLPPHRSWSQSQGWRSVQEQRENARVKHCIIFSFTAMLLDWWTCNHNWYLQNATTSGLCYLKIKGISLLCFGRRAAWTLSAFLAQAWYMYELFVLLSVSLIHAWSSQVHCRRAHQVDAPKDYV